MKIGFLIGVNDVGGAEFVSYHHVMMAYRNKADVVVLSGTGGKFYEMIKSAGVNIVLTGMSPSASEMANLLWGCNVVFNCNSFGMTACAVSLKQKIGFRYLSIIHSDIDWVYNQLARYDDHTDGYYAIHQKIADNFIARGVMAAWKFTVIPNCVDTTKILSLNGCREKVRRELGYSDTDFVIGMISRVAADKNILDAVKIVSRLPESINAKLLIVGGASESAASKAYFRRVQRLSGSIMGGRFKSRITITGNMGPDDVYRTMRAFDIGFNCSPSEGLPIVLLEMMTAAIPCIMPGIGDIENTLGGRGVVVPLRQRLDIHEILAEPCFTESELDLFVKAIRTFYWDRAFRIQSAKVSALFAREYRSLNYQEELFLKFLNMKKADNVAVQENSLPAGDNNPKSVKVSVLMIICDCHPDWIRTAFQSIASQDYSGEVELVVIRHDLRMSMIPKIDRIISDFSGKMQITDLAVNDDALQYSQVLDMGISKCSGDIIVRMECDDIAEPELIRKEVEYLGRYQDIDVCGVQLRIIGVNTVPTSHPSIVTKQSASDMPGTWFVNNPGVAIRRSILDKVGGYGRVKTGWAEDYHLWCKILKEGGLIGNIPDVLINFRASYRERNNVEGKELFLKKEKSELMF